MPVSDIFIARQPIFDRHDVVTAYEILFRSSELNRFEALDQNLASGQSLERTVMGFGFEQLVGDKTAFVNLTRDLLVAEAFTLLPAGRAVIEVLETIAPDPAVLAACTRARDLGYRIALDDFVARPELEPLLALADIVKIDWRDPAGASPEAIDRLRSPAGPSSRRRSKPPTNGVGPKRPAATCFKATSSAARRCSGGKRPPRPEPTTSGCCGKSASRTSTSPGWSG